MVVMTETNGESWFPAEKPPVTPELKARSRFIPPIEVSVLTSKVDFCLYDCTTWEQNGFSGEQDMV